MRCIDASKNAHEIDNISLRWQHIREWRAPTLTQGMGFVGTLLKPIVFCVCPERPQMGGPADSQGGD